MALLEARGLVKIFGKRRVVDGVSFDVNAGEVVGLLGPNGAGKTTTMRMLTTFLAPSSGRAVLCGHDVLDEPLEVRKKVGYLPENVPLYLEMRVREYLSYRAKLKDVPGSKRRSAIEEVLERCKIKDVETRVLGHLSKGYRQRVGLADALVANPPLLILDEPTAGLDPNQIREVRDLIRRLGENHTILLSTHILPEVETTCARAIVIDRGKLVAQGTIEELRAGDLVWFAPGEKHWHGASPTTAMTHIAIAEMLDGTVVEWMEHVTDEQYGR